MRQLVSLSAVGDGLCGLYSDHRPGHPVILDLGSRQGGATAVAGWNRAVFGRRYFPFRYRDVPLPHGPETLVVSHFHSDHYNGLLHVAGRGRPLARLDDVARVITPGLPEVPDAERFYRALFVVSIRLLGEHSGHMETDLGQAIGTATGGRSIHYRQVFQGDRVPFGPTEYECLWPPREITADQGLAESIEKAIHAFHVAREEDPVLARLDDHFRERRLPFPFTDPGEYEGRPWEAEAAPMIEEHRGEVPEIVRRANRALRGVANRLSLGLRFGDDLLFLGDLEGSSLSGAVEWAVARGSHYTFMIAPHHGTKWSPAMEALSVEDTLVSNGPNLAPHLDARLGSVSDAVHQTWQAGDVALTR